MPAATAPVPAAPARVVLDVRAQAFDCSTRPPPSAYDLDLSHGDELTVTERKDDVDRLYEPKRIALPKLERLDLSSNSIDASAKTTLRARARIWAPGLELVL